MNLDIIDFTGKKSGSLPISEKVFNAAANPSLIALAVRVYLHNQRQWTKSVQTRSDVSYTTAKVWRQKGTGRARHGSRRAPVFVGGGQAHGPSAFVDARKKLTKNMRRQSLKIALTHKRAEGKLLLIADASKIGPKVSDAKRTLVQIGIKLSEKTLIILDQPEKAVLKSTSNLPRVSVTQAKRLNTYEILNNEIIILTKNALTQLTSLLDPEFSLPKTTAAKKKGTI
jgi:large subunit ribosomal protein L4